MDRPMDWMSEPLMAAKTGGYRPRPASTITGQLTRAEVEASGRQVGTKGLGTRWCVPGEGATWEEMGEALLHTGTFGMGYRNDDYARAAWSCCRRGAADGHEHRTNLALTGQPIQPYDLERIALAR